MNYHERQALQRCHKQITRDLEVKYIIDALVESKVFREEDKLDILQKGVDDEDQARRLLESLPLRGPHAFVRFIDSLKADYSWLAGYLEDEFEAAETSKATSSNSACDPDFYDDNLLKELLQRGGVPPRPNHFIPRDELLQRIKDHLCKLEPGDFLTLHGMPVSGKLVLASEALRDPEVTLRHFPDGVIWFRVGIISSREKLLNRLRILCEKLDAEKLPTDIEEAQLILKKLLLSERFRRCLLVLHDVWRGSEPALSITRMFVDCCRILITTRDITVLDPVPRQCSKAVVELPTGFDEKQSLQLFSSYVNLDAGFLPEEAKLIHEECQGSPFVISMLGSMISEGHSGLGGIRRDESSRWSYYLKCLRDRKYNKLKKRQSYQHESVMDTIMVSVDNLEKGMKQRYKSLVVFIDSNSLPKDVLMTYWDVNDVEVDNIMTEFLKKSLAKCEFDPNLETHVYSIHILFLDYLKTGLREDEERVFHEQLVGKYLDKCQQNYGDMEDDSYLFSNLGHHLLKSGRTELFPDIFLDLKYVEACLNSTSYTSVDLLNDYSRYGEHIMGKDEEYIEDLDDFEAFVRTIGGLVNSSNSQVDVVQLALGEPHDSSVRKKAVAIAQERPSRLYFNWMNPGLTRELHMATIMHHGSVETATFLSPSRRIMTANGDGQIKLWDVESGAVQHRLSGHRSKVLCLALSPDGLCCASGSEDGVVKIWDLGAYLENDDDDDEVDGEGGFPRGVKSSESAASSSSGGGGKSSSLKRRSSSLSIQHSREKYALQQILAKDRHDVRDLSNQSFNFYELHDEMVLCVAFSPAGDEVVASGHSGHVKIYNLTQRTVRLKLPAHKEPVNVCRFSPSGKLVCSGSDDASVRLYSAESGDFRGSIDLHNLRVLDIRPVPSTNKVISLSVDKLICWNNFYEDTEALLSGAGAGGDQRDRLSLDALEFQRNRKSDFICMSVGQANTYPNGSNGNSFGATLLAAATVDNLITVWDFESCQVLLSLPGHSGHIHVLNFNEDANLLLSGSDDETVMIWSLESVSARDRDDEDGIDVKTNAAEEILPVNLGPAFDVRFRPDDEASYHHHDNGRQTLAASEVVMAAPDERNYLSLLGDGKLIVRAPVESSPITCVSISDDLCTVAYGCNNGVVRAWLPSEGRVVALGSHKSKVNQVLATPWGAVVSACKDAEVKIWPLSDGGQVNASNGGSGAGAAAPGVPGPIKSHPSSVKEIRQVPGASEKLVLTRCNNGSLRLWDLSVGPHVQGSLRASFDYPADVQAFSTCMDLCGVTKMVVTARASGPMLALKLANLDLIQELPATPAQLGPIRSCRFSPDGKLLARGYDAGVLEILEAGTWQRCYKQVRAHSTWVKDIRFSMAGSNKLATAGDKVVWWNLDHLTDMRRKNSITANSSRRRRSSRTNDLFKRRSRHEASPDEKAPLKKTISSPPLPPTDNGSANTTVKRASGAFDFKPVVVKEGSSSNSKERLQQFDFIGSQTGRLYASPDFRSFACLDDVGIPYILQEILMEEPS